MTKKPSVAVIGAGLAGLTAALRLESKGYETRVYEARERVGGRVFTINIKNYDNEYSTVDVGGANITDGGNAKYIISLIAEMGLEIEERTVQISGLVCSNGVYIDSQKLISDLKYTERIIDQILEENEKSFLNMDELIERLFSSNHPLKMLLKTRLSAYEGIPVDKQCLYHNIDTLRSLLKGGLAPTHDLPNLDDFNINIKYIKGGNANLPIKIAEKLFNPVHLNKVLKKITKVESGQIKLIFNDGSQALHDKVILAIPIAVYGDIEFAEEIIPGRILDKILKVEYGINHKVFVPFAKPYIPKYRTIITEQQISFFNYDNKVLILYCISPDIDLPLELKTISNAYNAEFLNMGNTKSVPDQNFVECDGVLNYIWSNHPYSKCSYSGYGVGLGTEFDEQIVVDGIIVKKIFEPIDDTTYIIGEHATILGEIGTMEAAVESAERIVKFF